MKTPYRSIRSGFALGLSTILLTSVGRSQTDSTTTTATPPAASDQVVQLSAFEVQTNADNSYIVDTATAGLKTRQALIDIPTPVEVLPRTVIDDLGFDWLTTDYARFVASGLNSYGANNQLYLRGQKETWMFKDGIQYFPSVDDDFGVETVEVVKGINNSLFGSLPAISGMVLLTTKEPLPIEQGSIRVSGDSDGGVERAELDYNGAQIDVSGGPKISYRILAMGQTGDMKQIYNDDRTLFAPSVKFDWDKSSLEIRFEYSDIEDFGLYTNNFLDQNDDVSTIGGRDETYKAPWSRSDFRKSEFEVNLTTELSQDIQSKLQFAFYDEQRTDHDNRAYLVASPTSTSLNGNVIIPVNAQSTMETTVLQLAQTQYTFALNDDYVANYAIGSSDQQTNWGIDANYLYNSQGLIQPLLGQISVINPVLPADPGQIAIPGADDTIAVTTVGNAYLQHQFKLFADHLILTGGANWGFNDTVDHKAVAAPSYSNSQGSKATYKAAAVYKLTPNLSLFTSRATAFVPQSPGIADQYGNPLAPISSIDEELGIKTDNLFNGLVTGSIDGYRSTTYNQSVAINAGTAGGYYASSGRTDTRGLEFDLSFKPFAGMEVIGTLFEGNGVFSSATQAFANRTYKNSGSVLAKYSFTQPALKGLAIGADAFHMGQVYIIPAPSYPAYTVYGAFVSYSFSRYQVGLNLDNATNELYDAGGNSRYQVAIGQPRTLEGSIKFKF